MPKPKEETRPVIRTRMGKLVAGTGSLNPLGAYKGSRAAIRELFKGDGGRRLYEIMLELAEGKAYEPQLPDGRKGPIMVPTPDVRLRAATELAHTLNGRPVAQDEMARAEADSKEVAAIRAMDDATLRERVRGALTAGLAQLDAKAGRLDAVDAELVPEVSPEDEDKSEVD